MYPVSHQRFLFFDWHCEKNPIKHRILPTVIRIEKSFFLQLLKTVDCNFVLMWHTNIEFGSIGFFFTIYLKITIHLLGLKNF